MNAQPTAPRVTKETKNKIKVEFERTPLIERLKAKFINMAFVTDVIWYIFRLLLLIGIAYIVLFPFYTKIAGSFMAKEDFVDVTVMLIPKHFSLDIYRFIILENDYFTAFGNTLLLAGSTAIIQTFICCLIGYGLAKFKFKGAKYVFLAVILTMVVPHQTLQLSMFMEFRFFDILGIVKFLSGHATVGNIEWLNKILAAINIFPAESKNAILKGIIADGALNLNNTYWPLIVLSLTGLGFKNGLYIFMLRQFFRGVPDELEESAYIDGSGTFRTFLQIILPLSVPMLITVFLFAFSWQWTDDFYTKLFFTSSKTILMPDIVKIPTTLETNYAGQNLYYPAIRNTCGLMIIFPLVILYAFLQNFLVQGIERSGLTAD
ncbi:MAG: carbohydrate ABC transporter permease [Clostridia bacterium]|nr:carbohydrate ABC transporter permease [Clostridia bacterium]